MSTALLQDTTPQRARVREVGWRVGSLYPHTPEGELWKAVFMQAVEDADSYKAGELNGYHTAEAYWYLHQPVIPACAAGDVDSDFARRILRQVGILGEKE